MIYEIVSHHEDFTTKSRFHHFLRYFTVIQEIIIIISS